MLYVALFREVLEIMAQWDIVAKGQAGNKV